MVMWLYNVLIAAIWIVRDVKRHETRSTLRRLCPVGAMSSASCSMMPSAHMPFSIPPGHGASLLAYLRFPWATSPTVTASAQTKSSHWGFRSPPPSSIPTPSPTAPKYQSSPPDSSCFGGHAVLPASVSEPCHTGSSMRRRWYRSPSRHRTSTHPALAWHFQPTPEMIAPCLISC